MLKPGPEPPGTPRPLPLAAPAPCWSDVTGTLFVYGILHGRLQGFTATASFPGLATLREKREEGVEGRPGGQGAKKALWMAAPFPVLFLDSSGYGVTSMALQGPHPGPEVHG